MPDLDFFWNIAKKNIKAFAASVPISLCLLYLVFDFFYGEFKEIAEKQVALSQKELDDCRNSESTELKFANKNYAKLENENLSLIDEITYLRSSIFLILNNKKTNDIEFKEIMKLYTPSTATFPKMYAIDSRAESAEEKTDDTN